MPPRPAVTEVVRAVARQHTRMRGLVHEVAVTSGTERVSAAAWLSDYLVLHAAGERLGLSRESAAVAHRVPAPRHGLLVGAMLAHDADEALLSQHIALLETAVLRHARAQERSVLPRLLARWPLADLQRAVTVLEAVDTAFDQGASASRAGEVTAEERWQAAVADLQRVLAAPRSFSIGTTSTSEHALAPSPLASSGSA